MRKILAFMLLAGAAVPAIAAGSPDEQSWRDRADRQEAKQQHSERSMRANDGERPHVMMQRSDNAPRADQSMQMEHADGARGGNGEQRNFARFRQVQPESGYVQNVETGDIRTQQIEADRAVRIRQHDQMSREHFDGPRVITPGDTEMGQLRQHDRALPNVLRTRTPVISQVPREGTQPPLRQVVTRHGTHWSTEWRKDWRNDHRYDWRDWRNRHRSIFRLGFYYDPFGWNYRPYSIGWRLWPSYYSSRFWINDPWYYRLPYAPPGTRWIRYYNDAILVDTFTGEVVDVLYNFFW
jgi:hypothetical protein